MDSAEQSIDDLRTPLENGLRRISAELPKPVKLRIENAFDHIDRSLRLLPIDREMASFRAITAEEEAVTALIHALRLREYPNWKRLSAYQHTHKAAFFIAVEAIRLNYSYGFKSLQIVLDFKRRRIDVKVPLSEFGMDQSIAGDLCLQPEEPLDIYHARKGRNGEPDIRDNFKRELDKILSASQALSLDQLVKIRANQRNLLLYASDNTKPSSKFNNSSHARRKNGVLTMVAITIMILQSRKHQATVIHAMDAVLSMVSKMPADAK